MKSFIKQFLFLVAAALCLMLAAFYNKYPIVFSDSGTYLCSGFDRVFPNDRPITYGWFIKYASLQGCSVWLPIFVQSLMLSYVIFLTTKMVLGISFRYWKAAIVFIFLTIFASTSWVTSMVMADVFTPIGILIGVILLFGEVKKGTMALLAIIFFLAAATHFSHILIFSILFTGVLVFKKWILPKRLYPQRYIRAIALVILTLGSLIITRPSLNQGKSIMYVSTMFSQGIAQEYLKEYCGTKHYRLCQFPDTIPARNFIATWFEYSPASPLGKLGGWTDSNREECNDIMYGTLTKPKYIWLHILASLRCSYIQLYSFKTGYGNCAYMEEFPVLCNIRSHFKSEIGQYSTSRQNKNELWGFTLEWNKLLDLVVVLSLLILGFIFIIRRTLFKGTFGFVTILLLMGIILNAWDCGTFSDINERYGSRVMWFVPFLACLAVLLFFSKETSKQNT